MTTNNSIKKVISFIKTELKDLYPNREIESFIQIIFHHLLGFSKTKLLMSLDNEIKKEYFKKIQSIVNDLKNHMPIQYILKETSFYDLPIKLNSNVLIPRPETEELVDWIIHENKGKSLKILDIGTGSGCIAISLAKNLPNSKVVAYDISQEAIRQTQINSKLNKVSIKTKQVDILNNNITNEKFDIIVSNPPYVTEKEKAFMQKNVLDYEPKEALFVPNNDPLLFYNVIVDFGIKNLNPSGIIYFEINESFGKEVALMFNKKGFKNVILKKDFNDKDRMLKGILK